MTFLSFIHCLCTTIRPKNRVLINLLFLFVHDPSTKLGVTLTLLFILFLDVPIFRLLYSWQILPLHFIGNVHSNTIFIGDQFLYFVRYIHGYMKSQSKCQPSEAQKVAGQMVEFCMRNYLFSEIQRVNYIDMHIKFFKHVQGIFKKFEDLMGKREKKIIQLIYQSTAPSQL